MAHTSGMLYFALDGWWMRIIVSGYVWMIERDQSTTNSGRVRSYQAPTINSTAVYAYCAGRSPSSTRITVRRACRTATYVVPVRKHPLPSAGRAAFRGRCCDQILMFDTFPL